MASASWCWVQFAERAVHGGSDVGQYLEKVGTLLAVAHLLGASDLHLENVVATADGPVPVDLETLVQNRSRSADGLVAGRRAAEQLNVPVLGSGILPMRLTTGLATGMDVSVVTGGLGAEDARVSVHRLSDAFTDAMRIDVTEVPIGRAKNQPSGMTIDSVRANRGHIGAGFDRAYRAAVEARAELLTAVAEHPGLESRYIARSTRMYSMLLVEGREVVPDYFRQSMLADVTERIEALDVRSLPESLRLVDESVLAAAPRAQGADRVPAPVRSRHQASTAATVDELARAQAEVLAETAIRGADDVTWISICSTEDSSGLEYRPVGPTLYDGLAGIGLAACYAHYHFPDLGLDDLAHRSMQAVAAILSDWTSGGVDLPIGAGFRPGPAVARPCACDPSARGPSCRSQHSSG